MSDIPPPPNAPAKVAFVNRDYRVVRRALIVAAVLFGVCFVPSLSGMDMMRGGFAIIVMSGFAMIAALITAAMFYPRGRRAAALLAHGGDFLAEWRVPQPLWQQILRKQYEEERMGKRALLMVVWAFCILFGIAFPLFKGKAGFFVTAAMAALMLITGLAAVVIPACRLRRLGAAEAWVRVGRKCLLLGDELHTWTILGSWLSEVQLCQQDGLHWLRVRYTYITRTGIQDEAVLLPVPEEVMPLAQKVANELQSSVKTSAKKSGQ